MKSLKFAFGSNVQPNIFEGEPEPTPAPTPAPKPSGAFTQEQVNSMIAAERKKFEESSMKKNQELLKQFELLQTTANLTKEEKSTLEREIEELRTKAYTAEELAAQEREKLNNQHRLAEETLTSDRDAWRQRYSEATITRSITDAAVQHDAFNNEQVVALLKPDTRLVEVKDEDGNSTGDFEPKVFKKIMKDGVRVELELTPSQAVEQLKEDRNYFNLFKGKSIDGTGSGNTGNGAGGTDLSKIKTLEDYKKNRDRILRG